MLASRLGKDRFEGLQVESGFNKRVFWYFFEDSFQVLNHVLVKDSFGFEFLQTLAHNSPPFLNHLRTTSGEINFTLFSFLRLLAHILSRMMVIC